MGALLCMVEPKKWKPLIAYFKANILMTAGIVKITLEFQNGAQMVVAEMKEVKD